MLNHDDADRTLPPTERRRREARSRGEVVRSAELTSAITLLAANALIWWLASTWATELVTLVRSSLTTHPTFPLTIPAVVVLARQSGQVLATILVPAGLTVFLCALIANLIQTGWIWTPATIIPRLHLRSFISWERTAETAGLMLRLSVLTGVTCLFVSTRYSQLLGMGLGAPTGLFLRSARMLGELSIQLSTCLVLLALIDYGFRFWRHEQRLKMTVEERRRELEEDAVDPRIRQRRLTSRLRLGTGTTQVEPIAGTANRLHK